ncbi:MAG: AAA family ATPase, partial [Actinobacteria bacterium]|nr:AAA family ATPase [Actinomycetota bacterium]
MEWNPFTFGALALDDAFTDRGLELRELAADLRNGQDVVLFAPRRYGKSSLVLRAARTALRKGVLVAYCDLMKAPTKERFAAALAKTIYDDLAGPVGSALDRAGSLFRGLRVRPTIELTPDDASVRFTFDPGGRRADIDATIERLLELPAQIAADRKRRVAVVFDEFQEVVALDPQFPNLMRAVFQAQPEVAHVYLGSKRHVLERIFSDRNEAFWRSAKRSELGPRAGSASRSRIS